MTDHIETRAKTDAVFRIANSLYGKAYDQLNRHRNCHAWAWCFHQAFRMNGVRAQMMSGSAKWKARDDGHPDGALHFAYEYSEREATMRMLNGECPEGHSWIFLPDSNILMDPTAGYLTKQAQITQPQDFADGWDKSLLPPEVITHDIRKPFERFEYIPDMHASVLFLTDVRRSLPLPIK